MTEAAENLSLFGCPLEGMTLIEASAGTGKTWHICGLYLRLLLEARRSVREILVVTFTTAATAELKARIRQRMADTLYFLEAAEADSVARLTAADPFFGMLQSWMDETAADREGLRTRLYAALAAFDEAAIFTIHGFCQQVLSSLAFSAGQVFSAVVEPDESAIIEEVAYDFWRRHVASGALPRPLLLFLHARQVTPGLFADFLRRELDKPLAKRIWPEGIGHEITPDLAPVSAAFEAMTACWESERSRIVDLLREAAARRELKGNVYSERILDRAIEAYDALLLQHDPLAGATPAGSELENRYARLTPPSLEKGTRAKGSTPDHPFFGLAESWLEARAGALALLERAWLRLLWQLQGEVAEVRRKKQAQQVLSYNDMLFNVHDALEKDATGTLAAALRTRYPAALIDEFQDTDPLQFAIFDAIYGKSDLTLFLVGDPKQSIYRFRNADLHIYLKAARQARHQFSLNQNQRSTPRLIAACNALFGSNPNAFVLEGLDYHPVVAGQRPRPVLYDATVPDGEAADGLLLWQLPEKEAGTPHTRHEAARRAASATAGEILRLLKAADEGKIRLGERALMASDMAVLVRSHEEGRLVREVLLAHGIAAVTLSQESIWQSPDAEAFRRILSAVLLPRQAGRIKAALATEILGVDAAGIAAMNDDAEQSLDWLERFLAYHLLWQSHGIARTLRQLMNELDVVARLLSRPDGERRLTNCMHLTELLAEAESRHDSPEALMRWFSRQMQEKSRSEEAQLRLESDENLVTILTIHSAKGLEFPFVFCPFIWHMPAQPDRSPLPGKAYHDGDTLVLDYREPDAAMSAAIEKQQAVEDMAETVRLIYVAMTRAVYRCYAVSGSYSFNRSMSAAATGALNWLAAGSGLAPQAWLDEEDKESRLDSLDAAWQNLALPESGFRLAPLPPNDPSPNERLLRVAVEPASLHARPLPKAILPGWRMGSYSGMTAFSSHERAVDHDEAAQQSPLPQNDAPQLDADDILLFPAQRFAGNCLHAVFEMADFADESTWDGAIRRALLYHPPYGQARQGAGHAPELLHAMIRGMLKDVLDTEISPGICLSRISRNERLTELGFFMPAAVSASSLNRLLKDRYPIPALYFGKLEGYLKGFIDLVFEYEGRYFIVDWKSNLLGLSESDYGEEKVAAAMVEHSYHLQHLLYTVALDRYLRQRLPDYEYEKHVGGVFYLFIRGVRPGWHDSHGRPLGTFFHRADKAVIEALDSLLKK